MRTEVLLVYVLSASVLIAAEVSDWDKTSAIAGVVAAITGLILLVGAAWRLGRRWWLEWRRSHTFSIGTEGVAFVDARHRETVTVVVKRGFLSYQPMCYLALNPRENIAPDERVMRYHIEPVDRDRAFPARLLRGDVLTFNLNIEAKKTWKGYLCIVAADESHESRLRYCDFEVVEGSEPLT